MKTGPRAGGGGFADNLRTESAAAAAPITGTAYVSGIESLFALQEVGDAPSDRRALSTADDVLDRLEEVRRGLLLGRIGPAKLASLSQLSRQMADQASDPRLKQILEEIELRAQVELAKLEA